MHTFGKYAKYATIAYSHKTDVTTVCTTTSVLSHKHVFSSWEFHQIYNFGAFVDRDEVIKF